MPSVSVIVPTYSRHTLLLERCLPSILGQARPVDEIIIVVDGEREESFAELWNDPRIQGVGPALHLHNIPRQDYAGEGNDWGLLAVDARNFGLDHATGDWISMLDDDDEMTPDNISSLLEIAERTGDDFVYRQSITYKNGICIGQIYGNWPPGDGTITHGAFLMRRSLGYRYAKDCYTRGHNADADLWIRMHADGVRFHFEPGIIHRYHRNYP